jgi:hypothetical protein
MSVAAFVLRLAYFLQKEKKMKEKDENQEKWEECERYILMPLRNIAKEIGVSEEFYKKFLMDSRELEGLIVAEVRGMRSALQQAKKAMRLQQSKIDSALQVRSAELERFRQHILMKGEKK